SLWLFFPRPGAWLLSQPVPPCVPVLLRSPRSSRGAPLKGTPTTPALGPTAPPALFEKAIPLSHSKEKTYAKDSHTPHHEQEARAFNPSQRERGRHLGEPERRRRDLLQRDVLADVQGRRGIQERRFIRPR